MSNRDLDPWRFVQILTEREEWASVAVGSNHPFSEWEARFSDPRLAEVLDRMTFGARSSIPAPTQSALRTLEWVRRRENLVVCGPSSTGKTFFFEALGQLCVEAGVKVAWFALEDLAVLIRRHRADDTVTKAVARILRSELIAVDDIGLLPVSPYTAGGSTA